MAALHFSDGLFFEQLKIRFLFKGIFLPERFIF